jgi:hypothetical protein
MDVRYVALFCSEHLLGESLAHLFSNMAEIVLFGPWLIDEHALANLTNRLPDIVLIADSESHSEQSAVLATQILDAFSELSVIRVTLSQTMAHIYSSQALPARSADLVEAIRKLPAQASRQGQDRDGPSVNKFSGG